MLHTSIAIRPPFPNKDDLPMRWTTCLTAATFLLSVAATAPAADAVKHRILFAEYGKGENRLVELDADGKLVWETKFPSIAVIFQPLADGNIVFAHGGSPTGVDEINRDKKTVWTYVSKCPQVLGCQRLANGNTLVAEQGPCRAVEVNQKGEIVHVTKMTTTEEAFHRQVRNVHKLANGNILAAHEGEGAIREYDPDGKTIWEYTKVENTGEALRLDNGNTLIACGTQKRVIEVTPAGEIVWEFGPKDAPELNLTWISSLQVLKNGHYVIGNFLRGQEGKGAHAFEVTRDKKVVWTFADHALVKSLTTIRVLDDR
jgi:outer membrane protein assembly factor BamB